MIPKKPLSDEKEIAKNQRTMFDLIVFITTLLFVFSFSFVMVFFS